MDRQHLLPLGELELLDRGDGLDAGIADQKVDAAERLDGQRHAGVNLRLVGDVHADADGDIRPAELGRRRHGARLIPIGDNHLGAFAREGAGDLLADTARRTRDDGDPVLQLHGICLLLSYRR